MPKNKMSPEEAAYNLLEETNKFNVIKKAFENRREELQNVIRNYLGDATSFNFKSTKGRFAINPTKLLVTNVVQKKIIWDIDKLKKKLDKNVISKIIDKKYTINDMDGLIKYLKSCGVDPKIFKKFLDIEENVIEKQMDLLKDIGELDEEDIAGCYSITTNAGYIRITEQEIGEEDQEK